MAVVESARARFGRHTGRQYYLQLYRGIALDCIHQLLCCLDSNIARPDHRHHSGSLFPQRRLAWWLQLMEATNTAPRAHIIFRHGIFKSGVSHERILFENDRSRHRLVGSTDACSFDYYAAYLLSFRTKKALPAFVLHTGYKLTRGHRHVYISDHRHHGRQANLTYLRGVVMPPNQQVTLQGSIKSIRLTAQLAVTCVAVASLFFKITGLNGSILPMVTRTP